jgi:hypothetical protein
LAPVGATVPDELAAGAQDAEGVPPGLSLPALIRFALARLAGWPLPAAAAVARPRAKDGA